MRDKQQIEAMYYLSPLQQGLLFHRLADATADPYFYQYAYRLQGDLRLDAFEGAWRHVVERHAVLRTAFVWSGATTAVLPSSTETVNEPNDAPTTVPAG